jgi:hypothetical protein
MNWTKDRPTKVGWYWATWKTNSKEPGHKEVLFMVQVTSYFHQGVEMFSVSTSDDDWPIFMDDYTYWMGPVDAPDMPDDVK